MKRMAAAPKSGLLVEVASQGSFCEPSVFPVTRGRCSRGRNGQMHPRGAAEYGSRRLRTGCGDNVGKGHAAAGAGSNLQRPRIDGATGEDRSRVVWRMSPYERGRGGNAPRGVPRRHPAWRESAAVGKGALGTRPFRRDRRHPDTELETMLPVCRSTPHGKPAICGAYACQRLSRTHGGKTMRQKRAWPRSEPDSGNPTVRDRRKAVGNVAHGGIRNPLADRKGEPGHSPSSGARAKNLFRHPLAGFCPGGEMKVSSLPERRSRSRGRSSNMSDVLGM